LQKQRRLDRAEATPGFASLSVDQVLRRGCNLALTVNPVKPQLGSTRKLLSLSAIWKYYPSDNGEELSTGGFISIKRVELCDFVRHGSVTP